VHCIDTPTHIASRGPWAGLAAAATLLLSACAGAPSTVPPQRTEASHSAAAKPGAPGRSMRDYQRQAAQRIVTANPSGTYLSAPPDVLLAIPVLEVELNGNGSVKRIKVLRYPGQAPETTQMAIDAVHRAAPFGEVSHLPKPWTYTEVFLFRSDKRFKPRTLDE
jgi:hypothetical protein